MVFKVDENLKKVIKKVNRRDNSGLFKMWLFEKLLLIAVLIEVVILFKPGFITTYTLDDGSNSSFIMTMITVIACTILGFFLVMGIRKRLESISFGCRCDESVEIMNDKLFFIYRVEYKSQLNKRNLIVLDLNKLSKFDYNDKTKEIQLEGLMINKVIDFSDNVPDITINDEEMETDSLLLFDYFSPSLADSLQKYKKEVC